MFIGALGMDTGWDHQGKRRETGGDPGCCDIRVWTSREAKEGGAEARVRPHKEKTVKGRAPLPQGQLGGMQESKPEVGPQEEGKREAGTGEITASF